jgi:hypothetical protein
MLTPILWGSMEGFGKLYSRYKQKSFVVRSCVIGLTSARRTTQGYSEGRIKERKKEAVFTASTLFINVNC